MKNSLIVFLLLLASCSYLHKEGDRQVARVDDDYLFESDLTDLVAPGTSAADSLNLTRNYIDGWIKKKILIHQAEKNLTEDQLNFSKELEDYRNSLVLFAYENMLVAQRLDTVVSDAEIESYYLENQKNFLLKNNIVRLSYVKIPSESKQIRQIQRFFYSDDPDDKERLADLCDKHSAQYFLDDETWLIFDDVMKEIPVRTYNQEEFLRYRRSFEIQDSLYLYLVKFLDFKIKEDISPLQYERIRVKSIILNKRKMNLLNTMRQDVYNEALQENTIEIY
ncbi:MAG: hypothetical protein ISS17_05000 [Bacteroidales bacterium]|nr:hypothetical protein [Bacteroidales bacterium]